MVTKRKTNAGKKSKAASTTRSRKDVAKIFDECVRRGNPKLKPLAEKVRRLVKKTVPESRETINPWGIPTFDFNGPICFMMVGKNHVTFGFPRGTSLADPGKLLEGIGKNLRHVKLKEEKELRGANLRQLIREAAALNRETPLTASMRAKKSP